MTASSAPPAPRSPRERAFLAALQHCKAQRPAEAAAVLKQLLADSPDDSRALLLLGSILMDSDPDGAADMLKRCLALAPGDALALHNLGKLQQRNGNHPGAIAYFRQAADRNPDFAPTFNDLGTSLNSLGEHGPASAALDRAVAINPAYQMAHINRGLVLIQLRRPDEARQAFSTGLETHPDSVDGWHNIAIANYHLGNNEAAVAACKRALALDPTRLAPYTTLAEALERLHFDEEARAARVELGRRQGVVVKPCIGERPSARIFIIGAAEQCNVPTESLLDRNRFATVAINLLGQEGGLSDAEIDEAGRDCDVQFNAIGDADRGAPFIAPAAALCRRLGRPLLNPPDRIPPTRRDRLPTLLGGIAGLVVPATQRVPAASVMAAAETALARGPVLLRPIGAHGGDDLVRVEDRPAVAAYLDAVPATAYYVTDFHDFRSADGQFRKYRLVFVDREVFPYHLAIGNDWLVHYWRVDMADWMRREEEAFLADYRSVFRGAAAEAVAEIARRIDLDYAGMDCTLLPDGRVLLFEANATMLVHLAYESDTLAYKHRHVPRIIDAMARLVLRRAGR